VMCGARDQHAAQYQGRAPVVQSSAR
jgi:hypothetical protein